MDEARERLVVALVRGLHGLRGAVRVEVLTDRPTERFAAGAVLHREGDERPLTVVEAAADRPGWLVRFAEVADRAAAEMLRGRYLEAVIARDPARDPGEVYWHELVGTPVRDTTGRELGSVVEVYRAGGVDAYVVRGEPYGEFDLPAVRDFIPVFRPGIEIVVDVERLDLAPPRRRTPRPERPPRQPRAPRPRSAAGAARRSSAPSAPPAAPPAPPDATEGR